MDETERGEGDLYRFAGLCLDHHAAFRPGSLRGEVVTQHGDLRGVAFGGPIVEGWGSLFVVRDDGRLPGLGSLQRYRFLRNNPDLGRVKELAGAVGSQLARIQEALDPVERNPLWRVVLREEPADDPPREHRRPNS